MALPVQGFPVLAIIFFLQVFSFDALSVIKTIPGVANAKDAKDAKDQTEEFLKHNFLPLPTAPSDKFQVRFMDMFVRKLPENNR